TSFGDERSMFGQRLQKVAELLLVGFSLQVVDATVLDEPAGPLLELLIRCREFLGLVLKRLVNFAAKVAHGSTEPIRRPTFAQEVVDYAFVLQEVEVDDSRGWDAHLPEGSK